MEPLASGQIQLAIHSNSAADDPDDTQVDGYVFAAKLAALIRALKAADKAVNGQVAHRYTIAKLQTSTPTAVLKERLLPNAGTILRLMSGIAGFSECATAVSLGETDRALGYGGCAANLEKLSAGAEKTFGYGEVSAADNVIRIDSFLHERAKTIIDPEAKKKAADSDVRWFKGSAHRAFAGTVRAVDLRGSLPALKLVLSAANQQINCVCRGLQIQEIRDALDRRVRVTGQAIYDGKSGLPSRLEIVEIEHSIANADFGHWRGAFKPFTPSDCGGAHH